MNIHDYLATNDGGIHIQHPTPFGVFMCDKIAHTNEKEPGDIAVNRAYVVALVSQANLCREAVEALRGILADDGLNSRNIVAAQDVLRKVDE